MRLATGEVSASHVDAICAVLQAIMPFVQAKYPDDPQRALAYALIVLEDVSVAVQLGLSFGLSIDRVLANVGVDEVGAGVPH